METLDYMRFLGAFVLVLGLMWGLAIILRRLNARNFIPGMQQKRLNVLEMRAIDARHRLALVSCDDTQHLVVLSPTGTTLLQTIPQKAPVNDHP